jgi:hypothetical protein
MGTHAPPSQYTRRGGEEQASREYGMGGGGTRKPGDGGVVWGVPSAGVASLGLVLVLSPDNFFFSPDCFMGNLCQGSEIPVCLLCLNTCEVKIAGLSSLTEYQPGGGSLKRLEKDSPVHLSIVVIVKTEGVYQRPEIGVGNIQLERQLLKTLSTGSLAVGALRILTLALTIKSSVGLEFPVKAVRMVVVNGDGNAHKKVSSKRGLKVIYIKGGIMSRIK